MPMSECQVINAIRLEQDWSFRTLAAKMRRGGVVIPWRTLHYLMTQEDKQSLVRDRTQFKLRKFLTYAKTQGWIKGETDGAPELRSHNVRRRGSDRARLRTEPVSRR
jgi:hypothetical protein